LGDRQGEFVGSATEIEQPLRRPARHIEEHRICQGVVHHPKTIRQKGHDSPQQFGSRLVETAHRVVGNREHLGGFEGSGIGGSLTVIEERHLPEEVAFLHEREHRLTAVDRLASDGHPSAHHHEQRRRIVILSEDDVVAVEFVCSAHLRKGVETRLVEGAEQIERPERVGVLHVAEGNRGARGGPFRAPSQVPGRLDRGRPATDRHMDPGGRVFVETVRLLIVLLATIAGHDLASDLSPDGAFLGALIGAGLGYVGGGVIGRLSARALDGFERRSRPHTVAQLLTAATTTALFSIIGCAVGATFLILFPFRWITPLAALAVWLLGAFGARLGYRRSGELLSVLGLSPRELAAARRFGQEHSDGAMLVDTSAILDGRLLQVARAGFVAGDLLVPRFVIDELQGIADAQDLARRRRGRRGLELLDVLDDERQVTVRIVDDEVPEVAEVDAKLVVLCRRMGVGLLTMDRALAKVAELQGVRCLNLQRLAEGLRPALVTGEVVRVELVKEGTEEGQGVGYLADGSMIVVNDAASLIGSEVDVRTGSEVTTSRGRMYFGTLADAAGADPLAPTTEPRGNVAGSLTD